MNVRKYIALNRTSKAAATRDLQQLVDVGVMISVGKARGTKYKLNGRTVEFVGEY